MKKIRGINLEDWRDNDICDWEEDRKLDDLKKDYSIEEIYVDSYEKNVKYYHGKSKHGNHLIFRVEEIEDNCCPHCDKPIKITKK